MNFGVGKQAIAFDLPGVEHFATQRQDGLAFLVAPHFCAATGGVALHQKHFVVRQITALAVGEFAGQHGHARALSLLDLLAGFLAELRCPDGQFCQFFAIFDMLVQPQFQGGAHETGHQPHRIARVQALLDLTLKLGVQHFGGQHVAGAGEHVFGQQLHAFGQQRVQFNKTFDRREQAVAQTALVGSTGTGGYQVDITFAHGLAVFREGHTP